MQHRTATWKEIFSWTLFDFANTGFYVIIITLVFPKFFTGVIADGNDAYWGRTVSASMLLTALLGPLLGSIADASHRKKIFLGCFTVACVSATALLYFTGAGTLALAVGLLIIANVGFEGGTIFYDAFLPDISSEENYSRISGLGFAMGYLGSFIILIIVLPLLNVDPLPDSNIKLTFLIAAGFFAIFSLPLFFGVKERQQPRAIEGNPLTVGYRRVRETFTHLRRYRSVRRFLLAFFVYNDSILTVILFAGIFASETLKLSTADLIYFFMIVQGTALVGSLLFGFISNRIGARQSILITLAIWVGVVVAAYFITTAGAFFILGAVAGTALGSSQACSRALMALLTPDDKRTEFFGFYDGFFGKASAVIGPLVFGEISRLYDQRTAMLVIGGMFVVGIVLLLRVPDARVGASGPLSREDLLKLIDEMITELTGDLPRLEIVNGWNGDNQRRMLATLDGLRRDVATGAAVGPVDLAARMRELGVHKGPMVDRGATFSTALAAIARAPVESAGTQENS